MLCCCFTQLALQHLNQLILTLWTKIQVTFLDVVRKMKTPCVSLQRRSADMEVSSAGFFIPVESISLQYQNMLFRAVVIKPN